MLLTLRNHDVGSAPEPSEEDLAQYGRRRWRCVQALADCFWKAWKRDYTSQLQTRHKWRAIHRNLRVGDVVLIKDQTPRNAWPMAVVDQVHKSEDGLVRSATLRLPPHKNGSPRIKDRPIHNLVLLVPRQEDDSFP